MHIKVFGKHPSGNRLKRILQSPNYENGSFQNAEPTSVIRKDVSYFKMIRDFYTRPKTVKPSRTLPFVKTDLKHLPAGKPQIVWFGHSSYLIQSQKYTILVDPVFSGNASPVNFFGASFPGADNYSVEDFPAIDLLILTHDHYDHLDYETIIKLEVKVKIIVTSLGVGEHLEYWGFSKEKIVELDWWQNHSLQAGTSITATPARHFSGRGITRGKTFWSSFVLQIHGYTLFIGGDSGYNAQFKIIGEHFKKFDLAILECGQYGKDWPYIHMMPEETVQAAKDLGANILFPVHWSKFTLSNHPWNEPIKRLAIAAQKEDQAFVSPIIGQPYTLGEEFKQEQWWNFD